MLEGNIANGELILMPFVLTGMYGFWRFWPQKSAPALTPYFIGSMFGLAILTKVPAGLDLLGLGIFLILMMPFAWHKINRAAYIRFGLKIGAGCGYRSVYR